VLAARLHPDDPMTGDREKFLALQRAYEALADPAQRAQYDAAPRSRRVETLPAPQEPFLGIGTDVDRRLGLLSLLYHQRRTNEENPSLSARDLETMMGLPRGGLNFTLWYLKAKGYITREDSSECAITAQGVDHIEDRASTGALIAGLFTGKDDAERQSASDEPIDIHEAGYSYRIA
jgi:curved DNA-binding protein CbpA